MIALIQSYTSHLNLQIKTGNGLMLECNALIALVCFYVLYFNLNVEQANKFEHLISLATELLKQIYRYYS